MDYKLQALSIVEDSKIINKKDFDLLEGYQEELKDTFMYSQMFRTRTEMEASVLNDLKFPTPDSKYWQSMREQNVHFHELVMLSYEYRKNLVEIKILERKIGLENDDLEKELLVVEMEKKRFIALNQERTARARIGEIKNWHEIKEKLLPDLEYSLDVDEHQLSSYTRRWINQFIGASSLVNVSIPERNNLLSQLDKGIKMCREKGLLADILFEYTVEVTQSLAKLGIGDINDVDIKKIQKLANKGLELVK